MAHGEGAVSQGSRREGWGGDGRRFGGSEGHGPVMGVRAEMDDGTTDGTKGCEC
jgi:hypothetical protein